jgi:uncharacterized protein YprB with RNaseH-like and TPR domain
MSDRTKVELEFENKKLKEQVQKLKWKGVQRVNPEKLLGWKVGIWDLETTGLNASFGRILCGSVKQLGGPVTTIRADEAPSYKKTPWCDKWVCEELRDIINEYDIMIGYNSIRFDCPFLATRLLKHDLKPISSTIKHIDPLLVAKYRLRLSSNSLESLLTHLQTNTHKTPLVPDLWNRAVGGDISALDEIVKHNVADVKVLEEVFQKLLSFWDISFRLIR